MRDIGKGSKMRKRFSLVLVWALGPACICLAGEGVWTTKTPMPTRRYALSSVAVDGKIYAMGGSSNSSTCIRVVEQYDPITDTWTRKADMPMINGAAASSVVNGRIYVIGGISGLVGTAYSSVMEYDAATDTWTAKANIPTARAWVSSSVVNGKIYVIGGAVVAYGAPLSTVEEYDPVTDTWTRKADIPTARSCLSTSAVNGRIYAIGGSSSNPYYQGLRTVEEYDPATDTWTRKADMPTGRTYISTCAVNGKIYAIGGVNSGGADHVSRVEEYDPATDTWTRKTDIPTARSGIGTSSVNGKIYAIGGWVGTGASLSTVEEYDPYPLVVDFNGDGIVDGVDVCMMVDYWGTEEPLFDIGPMPWGDGIVDVQDLIVLSEHLFTYPGAVAYWKLDESEGMIAYDSVGVNDGSVVGAALWQPDGGCVDGALELTGTTFIMAGSVLNPSDGPFSVLAWVKGGQPGQGIITQQGGVDWLLLDPATGALMTELNGGGRLSKALASDAIVVDGDWHRIGFTWDGSHRRLYVDDVLEAASAESGLPGSTGTVVIGCRKTMAPGTLFTGLIDDVRIYNRVVEP